MEIPVKINVETATYDELESAEKTLRELQTATLNRYETLISEYVDTESCGSICLYKIDWRSITLRSIDTSNSRSERYDIKLEFNYADWYDRDKENIHICSMSSLPEFAMNGDIEPDDDKERMNIIYTLEVYLLIISKGDFYKKLLSFMRAMRRDLFDIDDVFRPISNRKSKINSEKENKEKVANAMNDFKKAVNIMADALDMYVVIEPAPDGYLLYKKERYIIAQHTNYEYDNKGKRHFRLQYRRSVVHMPDRCVLVKSLTWHNTGMRVERVLNDVAV